MGLSTCSSSVVICPSEERAAVALIDQCRRVPPAPTAIGWVEENARFGL